MKRKPVLLDLFCGAGGSAYGYSLAGFEVVGIDTVFQPRYPGSFIQGDALTFLDQADLSEFDVIHASPVCKGYTVLNAKGKEKHEKLIGIVKERLLKSGKLWIIENVMGAVGELPGSVMLCGSMFGLGVQRHRLFESNVLLFAPGPCQHGKGCISVHGHSVWDSSRNGTMRKDGRKRPAIIPWQEGGRAMGISWMSHEELTQAIPPAYTSYIGQQLMAALENQEAA